MGLVRIPILKFRCLCPKCRQYHCVRFLHNIFGKYNATVFIPTFSKREHVENNCFHFEYFFKKLSDPAELLKTGIRIQLYVEKNKKLEALVSQVA